MPTPASIRYNNPGAQYPGPSARAFGSTGYGTIGGGHLIAQFPDPVSGAAAQFDLLQNGPYSKMPLARAIEKWSGGNSSPAYVRSIVDETGLDPNKPVSASELADPNVGIPLAKAMAKFEAGRDFPMSDEDWQAAHSLAFGGGAPSAEPYASGGPAGLPVQQPYSGLLDPNEEPPATGSPAGNPVDAGSLPMGIPQGTSDATEVSAQRRMPPGQTAAPAAPQGPPTGNLPFGIPGTAFNNPIQQALGDNFSTLLAFAGGARQGGIGQGLTQAAKASLVEGASQEKRRLEQQQQLGIYQAIRAKGGSHADAMAAATAPPEVFKAMASELFGGPKLVKIGSNPLTGDVMALQHPGGKFTDLEGKPLSGSSVGGAGTSLGGSGMLAPGVKALDPNATGDAYLGQFAPEVQAAVKSYIAGDVLPTGNPRQQSINSVAKTIAQTYGQQTGTPVSDTLYAEKRKYRTELGSNSATTAGGQSKAFVQGIEHADALATKLEGLKNVGGFGIPVLAAGANTMREALSTKQKGLADEAKAIGQQLAGEVGKLFSGSAGGGVHERELTRNRFNTVSSGPELAGALEGTIETMEGGLKALEARRDQILGPNNDVKFIPAETEKKIAHIREIIARLKSGEAAPTQGGAPAAGAAPAPVANPYEAEMRRRGLLK